MKKQIWSVFVATISTTLLAQTNAPVSTPPVTTPTPAATAPATTNVEPAPAATNAPAKRSLFHRKRTLSATTEAPINEPTVVLTPGPAEIGASSVNVRGQASFQGEVISHLAKGDMVTVLEQINLHKHKASEPAQWAKIAFPTNAYAWVDSRYIDADSKTVKPKKLNLRAGPGENYSVVGLITHGTPVSEVSNKGNWMEIEPPTNAYAFVAAMFLKQETVVLPPPVAPTVETATAPTTTPVAESQPLVTEATNAAVAVETNATTVASVETNAPGAEGTNALTEAETNAPPPPPRIVTHEGFVRHVGSIIAPTAYELYDTNTWTTINYLHTTSTNLNLSRYNGLHIIVTGEESLAERWKDTPVLTIQRILVVE
jgi:uncharacterized protein YgiM (DUF1202 family)